MSAPQDVVRQLSVRLGGNALPREPMPGWRDIGCRAAPKGRPNDDARTWHAAEIEARAGPGVAGSISNLSVGNFFCKRLRPLHHGSMPDYGLSHGGWQADAPFERAQGMHVPLASRSGRPRGWPMKGRIRSF